MVIGIATCLLAAVPAIADPSPSVRDKQAQARSVLAQIQAMNSRVEAAVERYNLANVRLQQIRRDLAENGRELTIARANLKIGQQHVIQRVVDLYTTGGSSGTMEVIFGAQSLDDLLNRLDTASRVSGLDAKVVAEVRTFKAATQRHATLLREARAAQVRVVAQRAAEKQSVESQLGRLQRLQASIKDELARMMAAEQRQQAILARQVRARMAAAQAAQAAAANPTPLVGQAADSGATPGPGDTTGTTTTATPAPPPSQYSGVVGVAMRYLGVPYVWGGASPSGFDCSGLVSYVYGQVGVSLPHSSYALWNVGTPVSKDELQPGDLVFFDGLGHVGIYVGGGQFIHAPHTGDVVKISSLSEDWYAQTYVGARRIG